MSGTTETKSTDERRLLMMALGLISGRIPPSSLTPDDVHRLWEGSSTTPADLENLGVAKPVSHLLRAEEIIASRLLCSAPAQAVPPPENIPATERSLPPVTENGSTVDEAAKPPKKPKRTREDVQRYVLLVVNLVETHYALDVFGSHVTLYPASAHVFERTSDFPNSGAQFGAFRKVPHKPGFLAAWDVEKVSCQFVQANDELGSGMENARVFTQLETLKQYAKKLTEPQCDPTRPGVRCFPIPIRPGNVSPDASRRSSPFGFLLRFKTVEGEYRYVGEDPEDSLAAVSSVSSAKVFMTPKDLVPFLTPHIPPGYFSPKQQKVLRHYASRRMEIVPHYGWYGVVRGPGRTWHVAYLSKAAVFSDAPNALESAKQLSDGGRVGKAGVEPVWMP